MIVLNIIILFVARGFDEYAALQPFVFARELSVEVLLLSWSLMAPGGLNTSVVSSLL